jgi:hypothetical protein
MLKGEQEGQICGIGICRKFRPRPMRVFWTFRDFHGYDVRLDALAWLWFTVHYFTTRTVVTTEAMP